MIRLGNEENDHNQRNTRPDDEHIKSPAPSCILIDETSNDRPNTWPKEGRCSIDQHGELKLVAVE